MTEPNPNLDHHLAELQQVAADLRAARQAQVAPHGRALGALRTAVGRAFLAAATALLTEPGTTNLAPR